VVGVNRFLPSPVEPRKASLDEMAEDSATTPGRDLQIPCDARKRETEIQFFPKLIMLESHLSKIYSKNICVVAFGARAWRVAPLQGTILFFVFFEVLSHVVHLKAVDFTHPGQRIPRFSDCLLFLFF
jgi:hypothetical protein